MKPSEELFQLVKSMSKTEKGYFKKYCSRFISEGDSGYLKLFEAIAAQTKGEKYDERKVKTKFKGEKFVKNLPAYKNYLYELILNSLRDYGRNKTSSKRIISLVEKAIILMDRNLFDNAKKLLKSAGTLAKSNQLFPEEMIINDLHAKLIASTTYKNYSLKELHKLYNESKEALSMYSNILEYRHRVNKFYSIMRNPDVTRIENIIEELRKIYTDPYFSDESRPLSIEAQQISLNLKGSFLSYSGEHEKACDTKYISIRLYEANPIFLKENLKGYVSELINVMFELVVLRRYGAAIETCSKLEALEIQHRDVLNDNIKMRIFCRYSMFLFVHTQTGNFGIINSIIEQIDTGLKYYKNKIDIYNEYNICFYTAYAYFGIGDYDKAVYWLNMIMRKDSVAVNPGLTSVSKILNLMLHYELGNYGVLEYLLVSTHRYLSKYDIINKSLDLLFLFLKGAVKSLSSAETALLYGDLKSRLKKLEPTEIVEDLDIVSWLESKIVGRKFQEIVREKTGQSE